MCRFSVWIVCSAVASLSVFAEDAIPITLTVVSEPAVVADKSGIIILDLKKGEKLEAIEKAENKYMVRIRTESGIMTGYIGQAAVAVDAVTLSETSAPPRS